MREHRPSVTPEQPILKIGLRALLFAAAVLVTLNIATGILARHIPSGIYLQAEPGSTEQAVQDSFVFTDKPPLPPWRWLTASVESLAGPDNVVLISIIIFMFLIAGAVSVMQAGGLLSYLVAAVLSAFSGRSYLTAAVIVLVFMLFGSLLGSMEEVVVLVPIVTALALRMGWSRTTGLALSLGAIAFGFSAALTNPFTIGVAQRLAGLPLYSGIGLRLLIFAAVYGIYTLYIIFMVRREERSAGIRNLPASAAQPELPPLPSFSSPRMMRGALLWFSLSLLVMALLIISSSYLTILSDYLLPLVTLCFTVGGLGAGAKAGMGVRRIAASFTAGIGGVAPGIVLILLASGIRHILYLSEVTDTILYLAARRITGTGPYQAALLVYALVLGLNFFVSSGSAKAFMIIPIISPLADMVGLSRQTAVLAYMFGDGFSNIIYPTNALLLICLAVTGISYGTWFRWIWKIELLLLVLTASVLLAAVRFGY
jgi:uncharacterized ion transporter superfamily protein YfcC